jgi:glycosyltransferase involved in cell wall biosynthesis
VPQTDVADLLARSDLHVYPGRPFPVARSLLEALASGCVVLAASTEPVREVLTDNGNGLLAPPADRDEWERLALQVLASPERFRPLGHRAVADVRERYAQDVTMPELARWLTSVASSCTSGFPA